MKTVAITALLAVGAVCSSHALPIVLSPGSEIVFYNFAANPDTSAYGSVLYKATRETGAEEGPYAAFYSTAFGQPASNPASATISFDGPTAITGTIYALMKDGNLGSYLFDISGWNGIDDIIFQDFYGGNQGKISHVTIIGTVSTTTTSVPDGGTTVALLGLAFTGISLLRRKLA